MSAPLTDEAKDAVRRLSRLLDEQDLDPGIWSLGDAVHRQWDALALLAAPSAPSADVGEVERLRAENEDLKTSVIAFCAPWAGRWAHEFGLPDRHLHPTHYDILAKAGARMDDFIRSDAFPPQAEEGQP